MVQSSKQESECQGADIMVIFLNLCGHNEENMAKKVTMMDIARAANVSQTTVSLVLNQSQSIQISEETRDKVLSVADELGYAKKPSFSRSQEPKKIALILDSISDHDPFMDAISTIWSSACEYNYLISTFYFGNNPNLEQQIQAEISCNDTYVGVIYASSVTRRDLALKIKSDLPMVLLNCSAKNNLLLPSILPADLHGGYVATEHLVSQGYKNIAIITGESWMDCSTQRLEGYKQALIDHNMVPKSANILEGDWSLNKAYKQTMKLLALANRPDAIFCCSDYMAMGCYQAINESGLKVGKDIAVIGYDNASHAQELEPQLSSVELPYARMGEEALSRIDTLVKQQPLLQMAMNIPSELFVRGSTPKL